ALAGIFMALSLDDAYGHHGLVFAIAYWAGRIVLGAGPLRRAGWRAGLASPLSVSMFLTGPLLAAGRLVPVPARVAVWGLAALIDLASPSVLRRRMCGMRMEPSHMAERFGLFVLIAMGESVVSVGTSISASRLGVAGGFTVAGAFALTC